MPTGRFRGWARVRLNSHDRRGVSRRAALMLSAALLTGRASAQATQPADVLQELRELRARLEKLESEQQKHESDRLREHEEDQRTIESLRAEVADLKSKSLDARQQQQYGEVRKDVASQPAETLLTFDTGGGRGGSSLLNPDTTIFIDTGGSVSSHAHNKALNRFNLREAEIDFRAAVAPFADAAMILAIGEEIEQERGGDVSISRALDIEEGYINFHTLPFDTALKFGKFRAGFGRNNMLHTHDLPQVTRPLAVQKFFGPEGLSSTGASFSWQVPNPWNKYIELIGEVVNADGGEESPILGGPNAENPAPLAHVKFFDNIGADSTFELGGSYLYTHTSRGSAYSADVFGVDATYQWTDPDPSKFRSFIAQAEGFWANNDVDRGAFLSERRHVFGAYAFVQYQFAKDWYGGVRYDFAQFPNSTLRLPHDDDQAVSPYVSWYLTEFLRLRVEYQHRMYRQIGPRGHDGEEEALFAQLTFVFGPHPPHPYWVHR